MSGLYEAIPEIPQMQIPGINANVLKQIQNMNRMTLEFDGSKVRMRTASVILEYRYNIVGNKLEVIAEAMGQKAIMPMIIESDGSITYQTLRFYKKE